MSENNSKPLVSVVITCYNYDKYLERSIESALNQTYCNLEIVIVNDGSTDNSDKVISGYLNNEKVKYIKQANMGQAHAKNVGVLNSTGRYVAFLDADDIWCADKLEKQMVKFRDKNVGVVYCRAKYVDENNVTFEYEMSGNYLQPQRGEVTKWLLYDNFIQFSSSVVKKECFETMGLFDESLKMGIDWDLWLRISTVYQFDYVEDRLFYYRMGHSGQMSKNAAERQRCSDLIIKKFVDNYAHYVSKKDLRKSMSYTFCGRAAYFADIDKKKSFLYYLRSIVSFPMWTPAYKGIVRNLVFSPGMNEYLSFLKSDITRYGARSSFKQFVKLYLVSPGYKYSVVMRTAKYLKKAGPLFTPLYAVSRLMLRHYEYKFGISIPYNTTIKAGLYIGHYGGIIVNPDTIIGKNCNINHDVTIGAAYGGKTPGVPVIGDNVYFGPGSKIIGGITVGNNVAIGANCVLTKSVPDNAVVAGIPGVVISEKGSYEYVTNVV